MLVRVISGINLLGDEARSTNHIAQQSRNHTVSIPTRRDSVWESNPRHNSRPTRYCDVVLTVSKLVSKKLPEKQKVVGLSPNYTKRN
jgi:hypothetical protein